MFNPDEYLEKIANLNYARFFEQGYATAGHNGPHGHIDTPVRNTSHYLIIYSYLYKKNGDARYLTICKKFVDYLCSIQAESISGAVKCMETDRFDHLNGLIGQGWVIEALLYYYEVSKDAQCIEVSKKIFFSQKYDWKQHLWHRIELDGTDIDIDPTYNHQFWFAACAYKLNDYLDNNSIDEIIRDFLTKGAERDFRIYEDGLLYHSVNVNCPALQKKKKKDFIKKMMTPFKFINYKKFELKYMEYAYHIFDMYGFSILRKKYSDLPLFKSDKFLKAVEYASNIDEYNKRNRVWPAIKYGKKFNIFGYSYNAPIFEWAYVAQENGFFDAGKKAILEEIQTKLMWDEETQMFSRNQPDIETWNARAYEIIRFLEKD